VTFNETLAALLGLVGQRVSVSAAGIDRDPPLALTITETLAEGTELRRDRVGAGEECIYLSFEEDRGAGLFLHSSVFGDNRRRGHRRQKEGAMPRYVSLIDWTQQGITNFKDTVDRYEAAQQQFEALGVRFTDVYWTVGEHDIVAVVEAPDAETGTAALLALGSQGNVRTKTMLAFSPEEMRAVIEKVP
jgi:uncharacterized protein with GYD domain